MGLFDEQNGYEPFLGSPDQKSWYSPHPRPSSQQIRELFRQGENARLQQAALDRQLHEQQFRQEQRQQAWDASCDWEARRRSAPLGYYSSPVPDWFHG